MNLRYLKYCQSKPLIVKFNIFEKFVRKSPNLLFIALCLGGLAGVGAAALIPLIVFSLDSSERIISNEQADIHYFMGLEIVDYEIALTYLVVIVSLFLAKTISQVILSRISLSVLSDMRRDIYKRITASGLAEIENIGFSKLIVFLNVDVPNVLAGSTVLPAVIVNTLQIVGVLAYLTYVAPDIVWFSLKCMLVGILVHQALIFAARVPIKKGRELSDVLQEYIRALILGYKELKTSNAGREYFLREKLGASEKKILSVGTTAQILIRLSENTGDLILFATLGIVCFLYRNYYSISDHDLMAVVFVLLYVTGPISGIINSIPTISIARISLKKLKEVEFGFESDAHVDSHMAHKVEETPKWSTMKVENVEYDYGTQDGLFKVGPVNLTLESGTVTFIVGGNGSGKSTLAKIIAQFYLPKTGNIYFDDVKVTEDNISEYQSQVSTIFTDYYVFNDIRYVSNIDDELVDELLSKFGLQHVYYADGLFEYDGLSDGQRKRLALIVSLMESKDLIVFDEWAADQDPGNRKYFYTKILEELKKKGKTIVIITHDDMYFDVADQLIKMDKGAVV